MTDQAKQEEAPLTITVKAIPVQTDNKLQFTVELTNTTNSQLILDVVDKPPFSILIVNDRGELVNSDVMTKTDLPSANRTQRERYQLIFEPQEKKLYSITYPDAKAKLVSGTYTISARMAIVSYKLGNRQVDLMPGIIVASQKVTVEVRDSK
jgi:hypothetical protein